MPTKGVQGIKLMRLLYAFLGTAPACLSSLSLDLLFLSGAVTEGQDWIVIRREGLSLPLLAQLSRYASYILARPTRLRIAPVSRMDPFRESKCRTNTQLSSLMIAGTIFWGQGRNLGRSVTCVVK